MREQTMQALAEMMERAELLEMSMMDLTFAMGAIGMVDDEQFSVMDDWAKEILAAWDGWKSVRSHTSESMWTNMAAFGIGDTREFKLLADAQRKLRRVWKRRPVGLTA